MFPYPSGAGLHVGHPLGYIASDIVSRFKRNKGFNVLHPMGFDAFGLPAEQYAIQTGQHPAITTKENINRYKEQLENIGFAFDWDKRCKLATLATTNGRSGSLCKSLIAGMIMMHLRQGILMSLVSAFENRKCEHQRCLR